MKLTALCSVVAAVAGLLGCGSMALAEGEGGPQLVGVVSNIKVLTPKVADVSSLEAWHESFIEDGVSGLLVPYGWLTIKVVTGLGAGSDFWTALDAAVLDLGLSGVW